MMKRNGLVFVPPESPKRLILYPTQDSSQQQIGAQQPISMNGFQSRIKTALVTNTQNDTTASSNSNNNTRFSRPHPNSSPPKQHEKSNQDEGSNSAATNPSQRMANPYYSNPFFRPKIVTNQSGTTTNSSSAPVVNRETSVITTTVPLQQPASTINTMTNGTRPTIYPGKPPAPPSLTNGKFVDSETTFVTSSSQEESRRWAHSVVPSSIAQRVLNDERSNGVMHSSTTNITNGTNGETAMHKPASATDIVISLMDPLRPPLSAAGSSAVNILARKAAIRDDTALPETNGTPATVNGTASSAAPANNQNWRKTLLANFQKNSRNIPTAKIFQTKQTTSQAPAPAPTTNNESLPAQQPKPERSMILNMNNSERTFQASDTVPPVSFFARKPSESLRVTKQETNNTNNNSNSPTIERSTSLQVPPSTISNGMTTATPTTSATVPNANETLKTKETTNSTEPTTAHPSISIPPALITAKPSVVEQQRAIITRVMIRRDFVKSTESKPAMPPSGNPRLMIPPQAGRQNDLPSNNTNSMNPNPDNRNPSPVMSNPNRMYQSTQNQTHLSQKSLLQFNPVHPMARESMKIDHAYSNLHHHQQLLHQQQQQQQQQQSQQAQLQQQHLQQPSQMNENIIRERVTSASSARVLLAQAGSVNPAGFRSIALSATNAETKRKKEELFNKAKKRAASASAVPSDG